MTIADLLEGLPVKAIAGPLNTEIEGIAYDSRFVKRDFLFVAVRGFSSDGHNYISDAINRGAAAIVSEKAAACLTNQFDAQSNAAFVEVRDSRRALAVISAAFYGRPSKSLSLIGITGTNGKTTTSFITKSIIDASGKKAGLLGTICYITGDERVAASHTTPESLDLQRCLGEMVYNKLDYAVLEVSSHALALKRVEGCTFKAAAFTNFTQDHLDFHGTMDEYFRAKCGIFDHLDPEGAAILNLDDQAIRPLAASLDCRVVTYGIESDAMVRAEDIKEYMTHHEEHRHDLPSGLSFYVKTPEDRFRVESRLLGRINVYNILTAVGIAYSLGISADVIQQGVRDARPVEGRFEYIDEGQSFLCLVDYAHTDDALRKLILEARHLTKGRVITVFGCGGNRDKTKRPLMGAAASDLSDFAIVTSDNPRNEEPMEIIKDILKGISKDNCTVQPDRAAAIREAVEMAKHGDTVLVAGKGHEDYQEIKGKRHHFSDREVVREAIRISSK